VQSLASELEKQRREKEALAKINEEMAVQRELEAKEAEKKIHEAKAEYPINHI
jgi:hypothetical protein